jgi:hypothetical protein
METLLEQQRRYHEERERLEDAVVQEKIMKKSTHRDQINSEHRVKELTERSMESAYSLAKLYEDEDGLRKEEIQSLSGPNELAEFYERLRHLKEFHRRYPGEVSVQIRPRVCLVDLFQSDVKDTTRKMWWPACVNLIELSICADFTLGNK